MKWPPAGLRILGRLSREIGRKSRPMHQHGLGSISLCIHLVRESKLLRDTCMSTAIEVACRQRALTALTFLRVRFNRKRPNGYSRRPTPVHARNPSNHSRHVMSSELIRFERPSLRAQNRSDTAAHDSTCQSLHCKYDTRLWQRSEVYTLSQNRINT